MIGPAVTGLFEHNPGIIRMPIVADLLRAELGDRLGKPAGSEDRKVEFVIDQGQGIDTIEENLVDAGLLTDALAFHYLVVSDRVDQLIQAGTYTMTPLMSPSDVVARLAADPGPATPVVNLALRPGLRIEQIAGLPATPEGAERPGDRIPGSSSSWRRDPRPELSRRVPLPPPVPTATASRASSPEASTRCPSTSMPTSSCISSSSSGRRTPGTS